MDFTRALVTGASSGIGEAIARELAGRGTDLVLVARSADRLEDLARELRDAHAVAVTCLPADLTDTADLERVASRLATDVEAVDLLVNNAGVGSVRPFAELEVAWAQTQVALNVGSLVRLTHAVLPRLLDAGHGGVLNVSSVAGFQPVPRMSVYAATKAFVTSFTESLHEEVRGRDVHVTALCPGFTRTDFVATADATQAAERLPAALWSQAEEVAVAGVDGVARGRAVVVPGGINQVASAISQLSPSAVSRRLIGEAFGRLSG